MEWASWHFWGPGLSLLAGSAYFGGGNAAWRRDALEALGFDSTMLTEDNCSGCAAPSVANGHHASIVYVFTLRFDILLVLRVFLNVF